MNRSSRLALLWPLENEKKNKVEKPSLRESLIRLGIDNSSNSRCLESLPFIHGDATVGSESELQVAVIGANQDVDLPLQIKHSNFFANVIKHAVAHDTPKQAITGIEDFLSSNSEGVWENSWVRIPLRTLNSFSMRVLSEDMRSQRDDPLSKPRSDSNKFFIQNTKGEKLLRVPISYLFKLALAQFIGSQERLPIGIKNTALRLMGHFVNDNCSPEVTSFYVTLLNQRNGKGAAIAKETTRRFLLTHLLLMYANEVFGLRSSGQKAIVYYSSHTPQRQKKLNHLVSDSYYRELFTSPCLSGWNNGEEKKHYMKLCHKVLSRSQLNAIIKLRDAGINTSNLVILPNTSNASLSNNGTHISLGSRKINRLFEDPSAGFTAAHEKLIGDLVIKIVEHFLPLFVGTYTAAPFRLGFLDFHPETLLGFLPHQLDFTHLRMIWSSWKRKARINLLKHPVTPVGPKWLDRITSLTLGLKGDYVGDIRVLDYLIALSSTDQSPGLDGSLGNNERLKKDLTDLGVFDDRMSFYSMYKLREYNNIGFSGYEARYYSLWENLNNDMGGAVDLQMLITALAYKYIVQGKVTHDHIPDTRFVESERRHIYFSTAIGLPRLNIRFGSSNQFLQSILKNTTGIRSSKKYQGYGEITVAAYRKALVKTIRNDAQDLITMMGLEETLTDVEERLQDPKTYSAEGKLTNKILQEVNAKSVFDVSADEFNHAAEKYYRGSLKDSFVKQALEELKSDLQKIESEDDLDTDSRKAMSYTVRGQSTHTFLENVISAVMTETLPCRELKKLINLILIMIQHDTNRADRELNENMSTPRCSEIA